MNASVSKHLGSALAANMTFYFVALLTAMVISHFGVLESPKDPLTLKKIVGAGLLFAGVIVSVS